MFHNDQKFVQEERRLTLERKSEPQVLRRTKSSRTKLARLKAFNGLVNQSMHQMKKKRKKTANTKKRQSSFFKGCSPAVSADSHLFKSFNANNDQEQDDV